MRKILAFVLIMSTILTGVAFADTWYQAARFGSDVQQVRAAYMSLENIDGKLYAGIGSGNIMQYDPATGTSQQFAVTGSNENVGKIVKAGNYIYTTTKDSTIKFDGVNSVTVGTKIVRTDLTTGVSSTVWDSATQGGKRITGLTYNWDDGSVYFTTNNKNGGNFMGRFDDAGNVTYQMGNHSWGLYPASIEAFQYLGGGSFGWAQPYQGNSGYEIHAMQWGDGVTDTHTAPWAKGGVVITNGADSSDINVDLGLWAMSNKSKNYGGFERNGIMIIKNDKWGGGTSFLTDGVLSSIQFEGPDGPGLGGGQMNNLGGVKLWQSGGDYGVYTGIRDWYNYNGAYKGHALKASALNGWIDMGLIAADVDGIHSFEYDSNGNLYVLVANADKTMSIYTNTAVPEPSSMIALASGLIGMAGFAIRRKRS